MKSKAWLTVFGLGAVLLIGSSGLFALSSFQKFSILKERWDDKVEIIHNLENKTLYPSRENVAKLKVEVEAYQRSVEALFTSLNQFQRPLNTMTNIEYSEPVKMRVLEFNKFAADSNFIIGSEDFFMLGFDAYSNSVPSPQMVPILDYELRAIDHLLRKVMVARGIAKRNPGTK